MLHRTADTLARTFCCGVRARAPVCARMHAYLHTLGPHLENLTLMSKCSCNRTTMNDRAERHRSVELGLGILGVCVCGGAVAFDCPQITSLRAHRR